MSELLITCYKKSVLLLVLFVRRFVQKVYNPAVVIWLRESEFEQELFLRIILLYFLEISYLFLRNQCRYLLYFVLPFLY